MRKAILAIVAVIGVVAAIGVQAIIGASGSEEPDTRADPAETGPTETGPPAASSDEWDGYGIPPKGTALSTPLEGQPILVQDYEGEYLLGRKIEQCPTGCGKWYHTHRVVYADGRVLWWGSLRQSGGGDYAVERRLTPAGVDLVRSGVEPGDLAESAWAGAKARPYAPPQYAVCFWANGVRDPSSTPLLTAVDLLPAPAKALLDGSDSDPLHPGCLVVNTTKARAFEKILWEAGILSGATSLGGITPGDTVDSWLLRGAERILGEQVGIYLRPLWPDGDWHQLCCA